MTRPSMLVLEVHQGALGAVHVGDFLSSSSCRKSMVFRLHANGVGDGQRQLLADGPPERCGADLWENG